MTFSEQFRNERWLKESKIIFESNKKATIEWHNGFYYYKKIRNVFVLHRDNAPACEYASGEDWYKNGKRHREDGPASLEGKSKFWYINGKYHREDGPRYRILEWN